MAWRSEDPRSGWGAVEALALAAEETQGPAGREKYGYYHTCIGVLCVCVYVCVCVCV